MIVFCLSHIYSSISVADITIDKQGLKIIKEFLLSENCMIFDIDNPEKKRMHSRFDKWVLNNLPKKTKSKIINKEDTEIRATKVNHNYSLISSTSKKRILDIKEGFNVFIVLGENKRVITKDISSPSTINISHVKAIEMSKSFIDDMKFIKTTDKDKIHSEYVVLRKIQYINNDGKKIEKTLSNNVHIQRNLFGLQVINSKQIVSWHPKTEELLSYKILNWLPVKMSTPKKVSCRKYPEVIESINAQVTTRKVPERVRRTKLGYYISGDKVFPVVQLELESIQEPEQSIPLQRNLLFELVNITNKTPSTIDLKRPSHPEKSKTAGRL